jgi:hypothetical protein
MAYISTASYEPGFPTEWEGLDIASAIDATPKWYGVSSGNGNNGVSHMWPEYYVRTCEPYRLAQLAIVSPFNADRYGWAIEHSEVDGEADYTIWAMIVDPPSDDTDDRDHSMCEDGDECEGCDQCETDESSWSDVNGAWMIVEVFAIDNMDDECSRAYRYDGGLTEAFTADLLALVEE